MSEAKHALPMRPLALALLLTATLLATSLATMPPAGAATIDVSEPVIMRAAAVAQLPDGTFVGSTASVTITAATNGSGHVFVDTFPLTQVDMQGSARLAARVASQISGKNLAEHDFFFVIRSNSEQIGGPSAGATLAVGATAALNGWTVRPDALMTGTVNPDGSIGPVGGIPEKARAAADAGMSVFLFPEGQELSPTEGARPQLIDMEIYCRDELDIECVPVGDVRDAISIMTDHVIEQQPITGNVTGDAFRRALEPLSGELVAQAETLVDEASTAVARLPAGAARDALAQNVVDATRTLERARDAVANGTYYTAASLSFQSAVMAHGARDKARLIDEGSPALTRALDEADAAVEAARAAVDGADIVHTGDFESHGAAQDRLLEAESQLQEARALAGQGTAQAALDAVEIAATASERADTARWWLRLGDALPPGDAVTSEQLEGVARDTLTASKEVVSYVEAVFQSATSGATLTDAREKLAQADEAMRRGYHPGAMMLALEAETRAAAILKLAGYVQGAPAVVFEAAAENAARAIQQARERGFEPLLAQSVYEFSFAQPDGVEKLAFLGMARVTANLAGLPGLSEAPQTGAATRFQGIPETLGVPGAWIPAAFAVGIALGAAIGLAALMPRDDDADEERAVEEMATPAREPPLW